MIEISKNVASGWGYFFLVSSQLCDLADDNEKVIHLGTRINIFRPNITTNE
uniref:Uncharacterized protein n=1 Tax=Nelumbo nucifera TaxID=4432 RepID=A0A822Y7E5_NELNU|nr:TPA_asm: hypothetical protein HUJ06_031402 [Nelumbo nucifera]